MDPDIEDALFVLLVAFLVVGSGIILNSSQVLK